MSARDVSTGAEPTARITRWRRTRRSRRPPTSRQLRQPHAATRGRMSPGPIDEPKQLGQLHEQGVLTDEEFAAQKAKILGG